MNFDDRDFQKFKLKPGDVLINEGSGSADEVGKPAIWNGEIDDCCFQNTLIAVRPTEPMSDYLYFVFLEAVMSGTFVDQTRGVNIHHIGRAGLAKFSIPLPPADERQEIVRHLKIAFTRIEMLVKESLRASKLLDRLDQAIITRAFQGDLLLQYAGKRLSDNVVDAAPVTSAEVPPGKKPRASATKGAA
jgi:type I restriction enzyme S subunit